MKRRNTLKTNKVFGSKTLARIMPFSMAGNGSVSALLLIASCMMVVVSSVRPQMVEGFRAQLADTIAPIVEVVSMPMQTAALFVRDVSGLAALQSENARLKEENTRLRDWHQTALLLEAENKSLRELLHVKPDPQYKYISARILSDAGGNFAQSLLVAAGRSDGVRKGQPVLASGGVIGRVIEVGEKVARILLISDINSRVPVLVENSRLHAIYAGTNEEQGRLIHLPQDSTVSQGARIVTSGHGGVFPYGLPVGQAHIGADGRVQVRPFVDFKRMVHVRIVDKPEDSYLREGALR